MYRHFREFDFVRWHRWLTDILPVSGSKVERLKKVIEKLLFEITGTVVFGDGLNDLKIWAMLYENSEDVAHFVTKPVDEDGTIYAVEAPGLLK
ncbi:HAD hydrolase family protein [Bacillus sp. WMMC1349]|nr:HAD hydrolase family protein [Bacillus sp. WMMC1349]